MDDEDTLARALRGGITRFAGDAVDARWGARVAARSLAGGAHALPSPPLMAWRAARSLHAAARVARALFVSGALLHAAADLWDDADDGDLPTAEAPLARLDALTLLFAHVQSVTAMELRSNDRVALVELFSRAGAHMAQGQRVDLAGLDRPLPLDPIAIARGKSGALGASLLGAAALLGGQARWRCWAAFGEALATLLQVLSDVDDALLDPAGRDFAAGRPTLPLRPLGVDLAALYAGHAGDRTRPGRRASAARRLGQLAGPTPLRSAVDGLCDALREPLLRARRPTFLLQLSEAARGLAAQVLDSVERRAAPPIQPPRSRCRLGAAIDAARAFLDADRTLEGATEVLRDGTFGRPIVRGDLFGRLFVAELLGGVGVPLDAAICAARGRVDGDGWRYYPGHPEIPPDADDTGLALQVFADDPTAHDGLEVGLRALVEHTATDGLCAVWLTRAAAKAEVLLPWVGDRCPVAAAQALLGLWRYAPTRTRSLVSTGVASLARWLAAPGGASSPFYPPSLVDAICGRALARLQADFAEAAPGVAAVRARIEDRRTLSSRFGDLLETALAAEALAVSGGLLEPGAVAVALVDAQQADGGFEATRMFRTIPHPAGGWYGARPITTAAALVFLLRVQRDGVTIQPDGGAPPWTQRRVPGV